MLGRLPTTLTSTQLDPVSAGLMDRTAIYTKPGDASWRTTAATPDIVLMRICLGRIEPRPVSDLEIRELSNLVPYACSIEPSRCAVVASVVVQRRIKAMADSESPGPASVKAVTALLREARSLSRRADKLGRSVAAAVDDPTTQQFAVGACSSVEQLVRHLTVLEHQLRQRERAAVRKLASVRREH